MAQPSRMDNKENNVIVTELSDDEAFSQDSLKNRLEVPNQTLSLPSLRVNNATPVLRVINTCPPSIERDFSKESEPSRSDLHVSNESNDAESSSISEHILEDVVEDGSTSEKSEQEAESSELDDTEKSQSSHESSVDIPLDFSNSVLSDKKSDPPSETATLIDKSDRSNDVIKLDIRGQATQQNFSFANPLFNLTEPKKNVITSIKTDEDLMNISKGGKIRVPSPVIVTNPKVIDLPLHDESLTEDIRIDDVTDKDCPVSDGEQKDYLVEEIIINNSIDDEKDEEVKSCKSPGPNDNDFNMSLSTFTTEYRTFGDDYGKILDIPVALYERDTMIEKLTISLQESVETREFLQLQNEHLVSQLGDMQQRFSEATSEVVDVTRGQLSDFVKHENMLREDEGSALSSAKEIFSDVADSVALIEKLKDEHKAELESLDAKHRKEVEDLRTYFERKCHDMEKQYSEEVFSQQSARRSSSSSGDSLDRCPEALPFGSPLHVPKESTTAGDRTRKRSKSVDYLTPTVDEIDELEKQKQIIQDAFELKYIELKTEHDSSIAQLQEQHRKAISDLKDSHTETVSELKAHIQTLQNTEVGVTILNEDTDLELEKTKSLERQLNEVRQDVVHQLQDQIQALLGDPGADLSGSGCPVELSLLRDRIQADTHAHYERQIEEINKKHEEELSSLRSTLESTRQYEGSNTEKWRQKRQDSFDKNRHLDEVTKERDGLAQLSKGLQRVLRQLVGYFSVCEDEVNNTILEELLKQHLDITSSSESTIERDLKSEPASLNTSLVESDYHSKRSSGKRVHFAPDVDSIISQFDPDCVLDNIEKQADVSIEIQNELDACLKRLRLEAQALLSISSKLGAEQQFKQNRLSDVFAAGDSEKLFHESDLKDEIELLKKRISELNFDNKVLKQEINEGIQRENLLKSELQLARSSLAEHVTKDDVPKSDEVITEGYGICLSARASRPPRTPRSVQSPRTPRSDSRHHSLDSVVHGQHYSNRSQDLNTELETMSRERDDLKLQLEQTNRLLRSTREFLDDQTAERESERDQYQNSVTVLKEEIARLHAKLQCNSTIVSEMSLLETQMRDLTNAITELENRKCETEANLQTALDKISVLREIICNLEGQLEEKTVTEENLLKDLDQLRILCEEKDVKIRDLQDGYDAIKLEMEKTSTAADPDPASGDSERENNQKLITNIRIQLETLESAVSKSTSALERLYDKCLHSNSEPSEDVSLADHRQRSSLSEDAKSDHSGEGIRTEVSVGISPRRVLYRLSESLSRHYRADEAALKRIQDLEMQLGQLRDVAQEVRLERDALQQRLSEQALRVSSLQARLDAQRHAADALWRDVQEKATIQLHDAHAELQATKEALENREKQLTRLKTIVGEDGFRKHADESGTFQEEALSKLQRELSETKAKVQVGNDNAEDQTDDDLMLQLLAERNADIELLKDQLAERDQLLLDKEQQLNELMALKLEDEQQLDESENEVHNEANKNSARTLSDIISISEYDESDLQVRKAELRHQDTSNIFMQLSGENVKSVNNTLPPRSVEEIEFANGSPRFDLGISRESKRGTRVNSLPNLESSTKHKIANKSNSLMDSYKRNVNETVMFGVSLKSDKHSTAHQVDNSIAPNREASFKKPNVEPKRINFSTPSSDNIVLDYDQTIYPDVLTQLKSEISRLNAELTDRNTALNSAREKLELFNAVQTELEEAQCLLQDSVKTINTDKQYYNEQIENFKTVEDDLKKRLEYAVIQANEKSADLQVLKQDILKRENMVLELAKEKRAIQQRLDEMELRLEVLQNKADLYESACTENERIRHKLQDLQNIEELVSEKNIQIDSLNEHLDRLDNLQRKLEEKDEQLETLKAEILSKSTEINQLKELSSENAALKEKLTKIEKEQENIQVKERAVEKREKDIEKTLEINSELSVKIEEMKQLNERLKDKEYEVEILNEDISAFHVEIASLKEQLASRSPSPSPRDSSGKKKLMDSPSRQATNDKRELGKITKQVIQLQNELGGNKKELNNKVLELELAKLEIIKLRNELEAMRNFILEKDRDIRNMATESNALKDQLQAIADKIREDGNLEDLRQKLQSKCDECLELEREVEVLKEVMERMRSQSPMDNSRLAILAPGDASALACTAPSRSSRRLSINEIEERLKQELDTSQKLDETLLDQILADREKADDESNQYDIGKRNFPISSEHIVKLMSDNEHLKKQVSVLEDRIHDKDILIQELNSIREGLMRDLQIAEARNEDERDNGERLQLVLESERHTTKNLQEQDCNIIHVLKSRLESALDSKSELESSFRQEQEMRKQLDKQLKSKRDRRGGGDDAMKKLEERLEDEIDKGELLLSELQLLKAKRISDKDRMVDMQHILDREKSTFQLESEKNTSSLNTLKAQLVEMRRKERAVQSELDHTRAQLQLRVTEVNSLQHRMSRIKNHEGRSNDNAMTELIEQNSKLNKQKVELINEMHLMKEKFLKHTRKEPQTYTSTTVLNIHDDGDNQVRHLYSCYIRVESFRKALVHQKKFLLRSLGPHGLFTQLQVSPRKKKSFRSVVIGIMAISRMRYLVRRWHSGRKLVDVLFSKVSAYPAEKKPQQTSRTATQQSGRYHVSSSPPCRERSSARRNTAGDTSASMLGTATTSNNPLQPNTDNIVYRDVLGMYSNPELFSATITINDKKRNESRQTEDDTTRLHSPLNVDTSTLLSHYFQRLDRSAKLVKKSLDTPRSTH